MHNLSTQHIKKCYKNDVEKKCAERAEYSYFMAVTISSHEKWLFWLQLSHHNIQQVQLFYSTSFSPNREISSESKAGRFRNFRSFLNITKYEIYSLVHNRNLFQVQRNCLYSSPYSVT